MMMGSRGGLEGAINHLGQVSCLLTTAAAAAVPDPSQKSFKARQLCLLSSFIENIPAQLPSPK